MDEQLVTAAKAARLVGVSRQLLHYWRKQGLLPTHPTGLAGVVGYRPSEVAAVANRERPAGWPAGRARKRPDDAATN